MIGLLLLWLFMVRLRWLRNMDSRRSPGEVVGSHSCVCASCPYAEGAGWAAAASLAHYMAS